MELQIIQSKIYELRGQKVMLDFDLAELYQVETKNLNLSVKRNMKRFPEDFMFQLTKEEWDNLRFHFATSKWGGRRYLPFAFTEQGLAMLSGVLNSDIAIEVNISIMRAFVVIRRSLLGYPVSKEIENLKKRIHVLEDQAKETLKVISDLSEDNQSAFDDIYMALTQLAQKKNQQENKPRNPVGFVKPGN